MSLTPYTRESMRAFKAEKDEEIKNMKIDFIVKLIYEGAVRFAEFDKSTIYKYNLGNHLGNPVDDNNVSYGTITIPSRVLNPLQRGGLTASVTKSNIIENMEQILTRLRSLFIDCSVEYKKISTATGRDGKEYDISALDDKLRPFIDVNRAKISDNIVIDWS
jgi:hypothetical protein